MTAPLCADASVPRGSDIAADAFPAGKARRRPERALASGFTLVELMITVAIVAILATIAYPSYTDYITRGRLANVTNILAGVRAQMEQYYQDNRTYAAVGTFTPPCQAIASAAEFALSCTIATNGNGYTMTATGSGTTAGFTYTVNESNLQQTTAAPAGWNTSTSCWITKRGQTC